MGQLGGSQEKLLLNEATPATEDGDEMGFPQIEDLTALTAEEKR